MEVSRGKARGTLLQDAHKMCKRAHLSCHPMSMEHLQPHAEHLLGRGRRVWKAAGTQAEAMKWCKMYQSILLTGTVSAPETERSLWNLGTATLSFCPCISNGECDWQVHRMSSLKVHRTTTKLRAIFQLSNRTVTSSAQANGMGQSVQTVLHITLQPLDIIWIQQPLPFNSSPDPALCCFWAGSKCYHSSRGAGLSRSH